MSELVKDEAVLDTANELAVVDTASELVGVNPTDEVVPLEIVVKRDLKTASGNKFDAIDVKLVLPTFRDGKYIGEQLRKLPLKFSDKPNAFKTDNLTDLESAKDLNTGTLYVKLGGISPIFSYREFTDTDGKIKPQPNDKGKKPALWINSGIVAFVKIMANKSVFNVNAYRAKKQALEEIKEAETEELEEACETE